MTYTSSVAFCSQSLTFCGAMENPSVCKKYKVPATRQNAPYLHETPTAALRSKKAPLQVARLSLLPGPEVAGVVPLWFQPNNVQGKRLVGLPRPRTGDAEVVPHSFQPVFTCHPVFLGFDGCLKRRISANGRRTTDNVVAIEAIKLLVCSPNTQPTQQSKEPHQASSQPGSQSTKLSNWLSVPSHYDPI